MKIETFSIESKFKPVIVTITLESFLELQRLKDSIALSTGVEVGELYHCLATIVMDNRNKRC